MESKTEFTNWVLLSGGIDSTTVLTAVLNEFPDHHTNAISLKYPSKHNSHERQAAKRVAEHFWVNLITIDVSSVFSTFKSALLTDDEREIPEGHYNDENMKQTVVPIRNIIFTSIVVGNIMSWINTPFRIYLGVHVGDHTIYPDCRPKTLRALNDSVHYGSDGQASVHAPLLELDKKGIVLTGLAMGAPYHLTRTCYTSSSVACGRCGSCVERLEAFKLANTEDPIAYQKN